MLTTLRNVHLATTYVSLNHFWSLAIEEHFYLTWPLIVYLTRNRRRALATVAIAFIIISIISREYVRATLGARGAYVLTPCRLDGLTLGALLAIAGDRIQPSRWTRSIGLACLAAMIGIAVIRHGESAHDHLVQLAFPVVALGAAMLLVEAKVAQTGILTWRWLRALGKYSYGIYVYHGLIRPTAEKLLKLAVHADVDPLRSQAIAVAFTILASAVAVGIAVVSFHVFEQRFLAMKDRFYAGGPKLAAGASPRSG